MGEPPDTVDTAYLPSSRCMNKKALTEADILTRFVTPAVVAKWDVMTQVAASRATAANLLSTFGVEFTSA